MNVLATSSGLGGAGYGYDFTKMSNKQLYQAAATLQSEGKISIDQEAALQYAAQGGESVSVEGDSTNIGLSQLNSGETHNFLSEFQGIYQSLKTTPGSVGADMYKSLVGVLEGTESVQGMDADMVSINA